MSTRIPLRSRLWLKFTNLFRKRKKACIISFPKITENPDGTVVVTGGYFQFVSRGGIGWEQTADGRTFMGGYSIEELKAMSSTESALKSRIAVLENEVRDWKAGAEIDYRHLQDYVRAKNVEKAARIHAEKSRDQAVAVLEEATRLTTRQAAEIERLRSLLGEHHGV